MSDETPAESPQSSEAPKSKRKTARKRVAKGAKTAAAETPDQVAVPPTGDVPAPAPAPKTETAPAPAKVVRISERHAEPAAGASAGQAPEPPATGESGEPVAVIAEPPSAEAAGGKRRRRRRRKPGQGDEGGDAEAPPAARPRLDPEAVAKRAWKIYLSEVSEEGLALISDQDAKELTRRSFRMAEIFLEEAARRQPGRD